MSGYDSASRDAYQRVDVTVGQQRILDWFERNPTLQATRQELVHHCRAPINIITARVCELLQAGKLESLPTVEGRHPLRLTNAAGRPKPTIAAQTGRSRDIPAAPQSHDVGAPAAPIGVIPTLFSRQSMTLDEANRSTGREAELVRRYGQFRIWDDGQNLNECARVAEILKA